MPNPIAFLTTSSIDFGMFGDFIIESNDLRVITKPIQARMQALVDLLKSAVGDYFYLNRYGTPLDSYIGKGLDATVQRDIENSLKRAIIDENIFDATEFNIYSIIDVNTLYIRIFLFEGTPEEATVNMTYDINKGVTIGY